MGKVELKIEVDERLVKRARASGLSLEEALQAGVEALESKPLGVVAAHERQKQDPKGAEERARRWAEENAEAIKAYNERIKRRGIFGADLRRW